MAGLMRGQGSVSSLKYLAMADTGSPAVAAVAPAVVVAEGPVNRCKQTISKCKHFRRKDSTNSIIKVHGEYIHYKCCYETIQN